MDSNTGARLDLDLRPFPVSLFSRTFVVLKKHRWFVYSVIKGVRTTYPFVTRQSRRYSGDLLCRNFRGNRLATFFFSGEEFHHDFTVIEITSLQISPLAGSYRADTNTNMITCSHLSTVICAHTDGFLTAYALRPKGCRAGQQGQRSPANAVDQMWSHAAALTAFCMRNRGRLRWHLGWQGFGSRVLSCIGARMTTFMHQNF